MFLVKKAEKLMRIKFAGRPNLIEHTLKVAEKSLEIARDLRRKGINVDIELVLTGALLHDIGRTVTHDVKHGFEGGKIVRNLGFPESIARIVERHVGAGITAEEAKKLGLPAIDFVPETIEEKIVCYADKFVETVFHFRTKNGEQVVERREVVFETIEPTIKKFIKIFGEDSPVVSRLISLKNEMEKLLRS